MDAAERSGYLPAVRAQVRGMCVPLWWHGYASDGKYKILRNGTASFVDTGVCRLGVTADHVLDQYLIDTKQDPTITCQLGNTTASLRPRVIARDGRLDLATFAASEILVAASGVSFHAPREWPTPPVQAGELLLCGGYPGTLRLEHEATADFPFQWFLGRTASSSTHNISLEVDFGNFHVPLGEVAALNRTLGGMSGGPLFRHIAGPIEHLEIVGVIYQHQESYGLLLARPIQSIMPDGTLAPEDGAA
jgi:hypothetical protein